MSDVKYLQNGQRVELVKAIDGGFLVQDIIAHVKEFPHDEPTEFYADDHVYLVEKIFDKAPTKVYDDKIATLEARIASLHAEATALRDSNAAAKNLERDRMARLTQIKKLELLDDYIQGKITHYAILEHWGGPSIMDAADAVTEDSRWDKKLRLLSLFGDSKGDLTWGLSKYSSMSHDNIVVMPARSREEAESFARANLEQKMAAANLSQPHVYENLLKQSRHFGADIPAALSEAFEKYKESSRLQEINDLRKKIAESSAKLISLGAAT